MLTPTSRAVWRTPHPSARCSRTARTLSCGSLELKDGVPEKLEPLVAFGFGVILQVRGMRDSAFEEQRVAKHIAEPRLKLRKRVVHELALE